MLARFLPLLGQTVLLSNVEGIIGKWNLFDPVGGLGNLPCRCHGIGPNAHGRTEPDFGSPPQIIRVIQPGVFDVQTSSFTVRMRAWGVGFPQRGQPGYDQALSFTESKLVSTSWTSESKREFDERNLKVAEILLLDGSLNFSRDAIGLGIGWHLEKETNRYGPFLLAQLKAKRSNSGVWANHFNYSQVIDPLARPTPNLPGVLNRRDTFVPGLSYWVTSFGKIHRPGCTLLRKRSRGSHLPTQWNGLQDLRWKKAKVTFFTRSVVFFRAMK